MMMDDGMGDYGMDYGMDGKDGKKDRDGEYVDKDKDGKDKDGKDKDGKDKDGKDMDKDGKKKRCDKDKEGDFFGGLLERFEMYNMMKDDYEDKEGMDGEYGDKEDKEGMDGEYGDKEGDYAEGEKDRPDGRRGLTEVGE